VTRRISSRRPARKDWILL